MYKQTWTYLKKFLCVKIRKENQAKVEYSDEEMAMLPAAKCCQNNFRTF